MEMAITVCGHTMGDRTSTLNKYLNKGWIVKFPPVSFNDGEDVLVIIEKPQSDVEDK